LTETLNLPGWGFRRAAVRLRLQLLIKAVRPNANCRTEETKRQFAPPTESFKFQTENFKPQR
jgi:hypothetical protein